MSDTKPILNSPSVEGVPEGGELSISSKLNVIFKTSIPDINAVAVFLQDAKTGAFLTASFIELYRPGDERPVTIERTRDGMNDAATVGAKAVARVLVVSQDFKRAEVFSGAKYILVP